MFVPPELLTRLQRDFHGRYRIRWSPIRGLFQVEMKVGRMAEFFVHEGNDAEIRMRDGYQLAFELAPSGRVICPNFLDEARQQQCGFKFYVPKRGMVFQLRCPKCRYAVSPVLWLELSDALLEHLRKTDPLRSWVDEELSLVDARNAALEASNERQLNNLIEDATKDHFTQLFGIPSFGYTGNAYGSR